MLRKDLAKLSQGVCPHAMEIGDLALARFGELLERGVAGAVERPTGGGGQLIERDRCWFGVHMT